MKRRWIVICCCLPCLVAVQATAGEVKFDGSFGSLKALPGPAFSIDAADGRTVEGNLFHSFQSFSLGTHESATFNGPPAIQNILARVTGASSTIDGTIRSTIKDANLFLINPKGIVFEKNARLDVGGSFIATTADYVSLGSSGRFNADLRVSSQLTAAPPSAFGFLPENHGKIAVASENLSAAKGQTLGFIGGDVEISGATLEAEAGSIHVDSVSPPATGRSEVSLKLGSPGAGPTFSSGISRGNVTITNSNLGQASSPRKVVISGGKLVFAQTKIGSVAIDKGDGIKINASRDLDITGTAIATAVSGDLTGESAVSVSAANASITNSSITTVSGEAGAGGNLEVLVGGLLSVANSQIDATSNGLGRGGNVFVQARSLQATDGSTISSMANGEGGAGDVFVDVTGTASFLSGSQIAVSQSTTAPSNIFLKAGEVLMSGRKNYPSGIDTTLVGDGTSSSGTVRLDVSGRLEIRDQAKIQSVAAIANGSRVVINANEVTLVGDGSRDQSGITVSDIGGAAGGSISIHATQRVSLLKGAFLAANMIGTGTCGTIDLSGSELIVEGAGIAHTDSPIQGITTRNLSESGGNSSGQIRINFDSFQLSERAEVVATTRGSGRGGNIIFSGGSGSLTGESLISAAAVSVSGKGAAGNVSFNLSGKLVVGGGSEIRASTKGAGPGGSISISVPEVTVTGANSAIAATTEGKGTGGDISISGRSLNLDNKGSIIAETEGNARAGKIELTLTGKLNVANGSSVSAETRGNGSGGGVSVLAESLSLSGPGSRIGADTVAQGSGGNVTIRAQNAKLSQGAQISADTLSVVRGGNAGDVSLDVGDQLNISSGAQVSVTSHGSGRGGQLRISARDLVVTGVGSSISSQSEAKNGGSAGSLGLTVDRLILADHAAVAVSSAGSGAAGNLGIDAAGAITLDNGSSIAASAPFSTGGNITLTAGTQIVLRDSRIEGEAAARGGNISIKVPDILSLRNSQISASATTDGGDVFIDPRFVFLDQSAISANAVTGRGGNIELIADYLIASPGSAVTASSERGIAGNVRIDAVNVDLTGNLTELSAEVIRAEALLRALCTVKLKDFSSLIMEGQGGLLPLPGDGLPSLEASLPLAREGAGGR